MENKEIRISEFSQKILEGVRRAARKLVEKTAANNGNLVIADEQGNIKKVPAKELLKTIQ